MKNNNSNTPSQAFLEQHWQVYKAIDLKEGSELIYQKAYEISLDAEATNMSIKLDVNTCHSTYTFSQDKSSITFTPFRCTKMCCDSKEATALTMALANGSWILGLEEKSGELTLLNEAVNIKVYLRKMPQVDENFKN